MPLRLPRAAPPPSPLSLRGPITATARKPATATAAVAAGTAALLRGGGGGSGGGGGVNLFGASSRFRCRGFHTSSSRLRRLAIEGKNHYERLNVRHNATPAEIKKSFYALSKSHHPDANPTNPDASHTFSLISESYTLLSDAPRRAAYDRDVLRLNQASVGGGAVPHGSYHSSNPAGGRAPSGLSRRRGTFRGPPPSFYRSGGWGAQGDKRRKAHEESTGTGPGAAAGGASGADSSSADQQDRDQQQAYGPGANSGPWGGSYGQYGGMGPGDDPYGHREEVPHFDKESHTRTHQRQDRRRWQRNRRAVGDDDVEFEPQMSLAGHFLVVAGILGATFLAPLVYLQFMRLGRKKKDEY